MHLEILRRYYGDDIELVVNAPQAENIESYPGNALRLGAVGRDVVTMQAALNRISQNYPAIPKINPVNGIFTTHMEPVPADFQPNR